MTRLVFGVLILLVCAASSILLFLPEGEEVLVELLVAVIAVAVVALGIWLAVTGFGQVF